MLQRERQEEQRDAAQRVIRRTADAARVAVREPARGGRADDVEDAHHRQQLGRAHLGDAVVVARGDEVRADEAVGARAADEERPGQQPERRRPQRARAARRAAPARARRHGAASGRLAVRPRPTSSGRSRIETSTTTKTTRRGAATRPERRRASRASRPGRRAAAGTPAVRWRWRPTGRRARGRAARRTIGWRRRRPAPSTSRRCRCRRGRPRAASAATAFRICVVSATETRQERDGREDDAAEAHSGP